MSFVFNESIKPSSSFLLLTATAPYTITITLSNHTVSHSNHVAASYEEWNMMWAEGKWKRKQATDSFRSLHRTQPRTLNASTRPDQPLPSSHIYIHIPPDYAYRLKVLIPQCNMRHAFSSPLYLLSPRRVVPHTEKSQWDITHYIISSYENIHHPLEILSCQTWREQ